MTTVSSRRAFLRAGIAAALVPGLPAVRAREAVRTDVLVIGSGLAGLHAALLLESQGARVTILEGAERLGGRLHTADGVPTRPEYGASEIGRSYARVIDTARRLHLELVPEDRDLMTFGAHIRDRWVTAAAWPTSDLNPLPENLRTTTAARVGPALISRYNPLQSFDDWLDPRYAALDVSVDALLRKNQCSDAVIELASLTTPSMSEVSALALMQEETRGRIDRSFADGPTQTLARTTNIAGGSSRLIEAMAGHFKGSVRKQQIVTRIDMNAARARVTTLDGSVFDADFVIAAIPFSMLRRIEVRPAFVGAHLEAVQTLPTLGTTRAFLAIREPFWHADGLDPSFFSDGAIEMFWAIDNHQGSGEYRGMMVLTGARAMRLDELRSAEVPRFLLDALARIRPASKGKVELLTWNSWSSEPLIGCCRHMYGPGQITRFAREMIKPWQRLHLAGEHTRRNDFGMEAAMESGERAALEVLAGAVT